MVREVSISRSRRWETFRRLVTVSLPDMTNLFVGFSAMLVNAYTNLSFPGIMQVAVDSCENNSLIGFMSNTAGIFICGTIASWLRIYFLGISRDRLASRLRLSLFNSYIERDKNFFDNAKKGDMIKVLENDVEKASQVTDKLSAGLRSINSTIMGSISLFRTSPLLFGVSISVVPFVGMGSMYMYKFAKQQTDRLRRIEADAINFAIERFGRNSTIRLNGRELHEMNKFAKFSIESLKLSTNSHDAQGRYMAFLNVAANASLCAVLYYGGGLIRKGDLTPGHLTKFAIQTGWLGLGFAGLFRFWKDMVESLDAASRIFDYVDDPNQRQLEKQECSGLGSDNLSYCATTVEFLDVQFAYHSRPEAFILHHFSMKIQPCTLSAIAGKSGVGKSTIMALISGLYSPTCGQIFLAEKDITEVSSQWIRQQVGVVEQDAGLLSGTIASNIAYGKEGATHAEVIAAAEDAQANEFICSLPHGYETEVGDSGILLSGGQKARIALARALIRNPKVLLLDEATSALDRVSETSVISTLLRLSKSKTIVVFTHSELLMRAASVVHVIDDGIVKASGKYDELLSDRVIGDIIESF